MCLDQGLNQRLLGAGVGTQPLSAPARPQGSPTAPPDGSGERDAKGQSPGALVLGRVGCPSPSDPRSEAETLERCSLWTACAVLCRPLPDRTPSWGRGPGLCIREASQVNLMSCWVEKLCSPRCFFFQISLLAWFCVETLSRLC
uniref:Uncharacterized protein n=1 Tax=Myotis myotis TaxID=51298 RepID=A0A7J7T6A0_MYOMY|nr:hypothetical protein mMyoMyo1_009253 [Myotis myotis]